MKLQFILFGILLASSCVNSPLPIDESGSWQEWTLPESLPERDLYDACERAVLRAGYPLGEIDHVRGTVYSGWTVNLQPFRNQGRRYQALFRVFYASDEVLVRCKVIAEINREMNDTLSLASAKWEFLGEDNGRSRALMQYLKSQLYLTQEASNGS